MKQCINIVYDEELGKERKCGTIYPDHHDQCPTCQSNAFKAHERVRKARVVVQSEPKQQGLMMVEPSEIKIGEV